MIDETVFFFHLSNLNEPIKLHTHKKINISIKWEIFTKLIDSVVVPATTTVEHELEHWLPSVVAGVAAPLIKDDFTTHELSTQSFPKHMKQIETPS